jgi:plastocyanin
MGALRILRRWSAAAGLVLIGTLALPPALASASGGGGCGQAVTDEAGSAVGIRDFCFAPTILRVQPGTVVTFVNRDPVPHTVLGANGSWGSYDTLRRRAGLTLRFTEPGVYPYVCTYHVGMLGAVVVGDGVGGAIGTTTAAGPVVPVSATEIALENTTALRLQDAAAVRSSTPQAANAYPETWLVLAAGSGLLLGVGGTAWVQRRRRRSIA